MGYINSLRPSEILLVEDSPDEIRQIRSAIESTKLNWRMHAVQTGEDLMKFLLKKERFGTVITPDLILLNYSINGKKMLDYIKSDQQFRFIPVIVYASFISIEDTREIYSSHANCCIVKTEGVKGIHNFVSSIKDFWLSVVKLPNRSY
jgi:two-component system, chemotaxis family, response regulator Rcp1